jgi:hypothetical protein
MKGARAIDTVQTRVGRGRSDHPALQQSLSFRHPSGVGDNCDFFLLPHPPNRQATHIKTKTGFANTALALKLPVWLERRLCTVEVLFSGFFNGGKGVRAYVNISRRSKHNCLLR